ncbi:family 43 glycosylhydrolase [Sphingomonas aerolata]|uniref:family 43 glycosylhydrolase n=1 Tax=Sphingomonas aerolata TaxID=185951 RepID=UPI002FE308E3
MITAVGGTAGPPTGHMVIVARSRSIHGPGPTTPPTRSCEPSAQTRNGGRAVTASLVEAPDGSWWSIYHGFENGYWTLGRQALLDPIRWTANGWFAMTGRDLSKPLAKPKGAQRCPTANRFRTIFAGCKSAVNGISSGPARPNAVEPVSRAVR